MSSVKKAATPQASKKVSVVSDSSGLMGLSTALEGLREELANAWEQGAAKTLRFRVSGVTLTLEAVVRRETEGSGKIRWWLVEAGGGFTAGSETTQTLVLTLTPGLYDAHGNSRPLDVAGEQSQPGG
jgi:Trypsin-co-occurring domain 2